MWTRRELKERAKDVLRKSYWRALLVSFIIVIAGGSFMSSSGRSSNRDNSNRNNSYKQNSYVTNIQRQIHADDWISDKDISIPFTDRRVEIPDTDGWAFKSFFSGLPGILSFPMLILTGIVTLIIGLLALLFRVLIGYNLEVGGRRYFLLAARGDEKLSNTLDNIKSGYIVNIICTMFLRSLYTFLWSLLFVIPGIVKSYAYRMVPYILAENPDMPPSEAIRLSCQMTDGHKMSMFVLDISFLGWYILGSLALGVGRFFVNPYVEATYAQLYLTLDGRGGAYASDEYDDYIDTRPHNMN